MGRFLCRTAGTLALTATFAFGYTMDVTGPSDYVGEFTITGGGHSVSGYGGAFGSQLVPGNSIPSNTPKQMMFCVDFSNDITIPSGNIGVNLSTVTNGSSLADARFGLLGPSDFESVKVVDSGIDGTAKGILDAATALQRYQMAAYLVTNYSFFSAGVPSTDHTYSDNTNLGIQAAIWAILDPTGSNFAPPTISPQGDLTTWLDNAATWLNGGEPNSGFLANFRIVSDASIAGLSDPTRLNTGVQEFLTVVPEPGFFPLLAIALGLLFWRFRRAQRA
ncbi:MAG TPA: PEP-CTERM sorting domain-containing protein [Bryobacteraceae bacterium]|nr:PEP-CTERM sorting domain-containing protein [Bryobacteraceae bacterium]